MRCSPLSAALCILLPTIGSAQQVVVRDTIVALPPISICQDGATHVTACTGMRLRPAQFGNLAPFVGQPLEITGTAGMITCPFVDVSSVTVLQVSQSSSTLVGGASMAVTFSGSAPAGTSYLLFLSTGLASPPVTLPPVVGPIHLDLGQTVFLGTFTPQGTGNPYFSIRVPLNPALQGIPFYDQVGALHLNGTVETTNADCFMF